MRTLQSWVIDAGAHRGAVLERGDHVGREFEAQEMNRRGLGFSAALQVLVGYCRDGGKAPT